ncbi:unnamed protein product, partial [marine sediment metagenome]
PNGPGSIRLVTGTAYDDGVLDTLGYGQDALTFESSPAEDVPNGTSLERVGHLDTDDNSIDFVKMIDPTPQNSNGYVPTYNLSPTINDAHHQPLDIDPAVVTTIIARVTDDSSVSKVQCHYRVNYGTFSSKQMYDDGPSGGHGDIVQNDNNFSCQLPGFNNDDFIEYYISTEDNAGYESTDPYHAPDDAYNFTIGFNHLVINEIMFNPGETDWNLDGDSGDSNDEYIEIYNPNLKTVQLNSYTLTDNDGKTFKLTGQIMGESVEVFFRADGNTLILSNLGDEVILKHYDTIVDRVEYGDPGYDDTDISNAPLAQSDGSISLWPNGNDTDDPKNNFIAFLPPSPGQLNPDPGFPENIAKPDILITEVAFRGGGGGYDNDWIELLCIDDNNNGDGVDLDNFIISNLDSDKPIYKELRSLEIKSGEYLVLILNSDPLNDEINSEQGAEAGQIFIYLEKSGITDTDEQIVLLNPMRKIIDAVCWSDGKFSSVEKSNIMEVY